MKSLVIPQVTYYLLQEHRFCDARLPIYKIGRTSQGWFKRVASYKNCDLALLRQVSENQVKTIELQCIKILTQNTKLRLKYGHEYFQGDKKYMTQLINSVIDKHEVITPVYSVIESSETIIRLKKTYHHL